MNIKKFLSVTSATVFLPIDSFVLMLVPFIYFIEKIVFYLSGIKKGDQVSYDCNKCNFQIKNYMQDIFLDSNCSDYIDIHKSKTEFNN